MYISKKSRTFIAEPKIIKNMNKNEYKLKTYVMNEDNLQDCIDNPAICALYNHYFDNRHEYITLTVYEYINIVLSIYSYVTSQGKLVKMKICTLFDEFCIQHGDLSTQDFFGAVYYLTRITRDDLISNKEANEITRTISSCCKYGFKYNPLENTPFEKWLNNLELLDGDLMDGVGDEEYQARWNELRKWDLPNLLDKNHTERVSEGKCVETENMPTVAEIILRRADIKIAKNYFNAPSLDERNISVQSKFSYFTDKATHEHLLELESACLRGGGAVLDQLAEWEGKISITHGKGIKNVYSELCQLGLKVKEDSFKRRYNARFNKDKRKYQILF